MNHSMIVNLTVFFTHPAHANFNQRVKDPEKSLAFYKDTMGMKVKRVSENKDAKFNLYFLAYGPDAPEASANGVNPVADREGILELT